MQLGFILTRIVACDATPARILAWPRLIGRT